MDDSPLDPLAQRVLGVLLEKELATPEYYPLTLNALVNGCNQSSNRDPVLTLGEAEVEEALERLRDRHLAGTVQAAGARVVKYAQRFSQNRGLSVQEAALMAELLLRGPQTPGELRGRSARMYPFPDLEEVEAALDLLAAAEPDPLVLKLPRAPGTKESRYAQLLGGSAIQGEAPAQPAAPGLAARVAALEQQLGELKEAFETFRREFD
ncbi:MAG: YceH family protein [Holophaga sp.]|jgi:hypothetical protein